jgi:hypothetical protein
MVVVDLQKICCLYAVCAKDTFNKPNDLRDMLQRFERGCWSTAIQIPTFLLIHSFILFSCVSFGFAGSTDRWVAFNELGECFSVSAIS